MSARFQVRRKGPTDIAPESSWDTVIEDWATLRGWWTFHQRDSRGSRAGLPDWLCIRPPRVLFIELKVAGGRVSLAQIEMRAMLALCSGVESLLVVLPDDWPRVRDALT